MNLYIYGSGGNGCELSDIADKINKHHHRWDHIHFVDDVREEDAWYGRKVYRFDAMLEDVDDFECIISLGEPANRQSLYEKLKKHKVNIATLIHPSAEVSPTATIGSGCVIGCRSFVSSNTKIEENVMLEVHTIIGHDIHIESHSVVSSCSVVGGGSHIKENTFIGLQCTVKENITIGSHCIVGMGSSVFKNTENSLILLGNPARPVRKNENNRVFK